MNTLDVLYTARATLSDQSVEYQFSHWGACTCGHIYGAETGEVPSTDGYSPTIMEEMEDSEAIREVAELLGWVEGRGEYESGDSRYPECYISNLTADVSTTDECRSQGLKLVNQAISKLEARHEQNRLDVLAQTKEIVDNVEDEIRVAA